MAITVNLDGEQEEDREQMVGYFDSVSFFNLSKTKNKDISLKWSNKQI